MRLRIFDIIILLFLSFISCKSQETLYIFPQRYNKNINDLNEKTPYKLSQIKMLSQYMIDPGGKGIIQYGLIDRYIDQLYPNKNEKGILCINLEGILFKELGSKEGSTEFNRAESNYIQLVRYVKKRLPYVDVGVYGLPFKGYYDSQFKRNDNQKLNSLLREVDVLMPSLYIAYPAKQRGIQSNIDFLEKNLNVAFEYGTRLNKPVCPFFWYLVHPSNKSYGSSFIPKDEMNI